MDNNVLETKDSPQKPELKMPSHWQLPDKNGQITVFQINEEEGFLYYAIASGGKNFRTIECFFDKEGVVRAEKRNRTIDEDVQVDILVPGEIDMSYMGINLLDLKAKKSVVTVMLSHKVGTDHLPLAAVVYSGGQLESILFSNIFKAEGEDYPVIDFERDASGAITPSNTDLEKNKTTKFKEIKQGKPNEFHFADKSGKPICKFKWEEREGKLAVTQELIKTGELKIVTAPLELDLDGFKDAVYPKTHYPKEQVQGIKGAQRLNVPWLKIGEIVGVSLGYSKVKPLF